MKRPIYWLVFIIFSCVKPKEEATPQIPNSFEDGYFVVCEGTYGAGNASISYVDPILKKSYPDIYFSKNNKAMGDQIQSMHIFNNKGYIVVQNSQKIIIVDFLNFAHLAEIKSTEHMGSPRYFQAIDNSKAYISDWKSDGLAVLDLNINGVKSVIATGSDPEQMLKVGNQLWVANSGYSTSKGKSNTISVIDSERDIVIKTIEVGQRPMQMVKDRNNHVWVLCKGFFEYDSKGNVDTIKSEKPQIYQIDLMDYDILKKFDFKINPSEAVQPSNLCIGNDGSHLFYTFGAKVYQMNISDETLPTQPIIQRDFYGLGIDSQTNYLVGCEATTFTSSGKVIRYKISNSNQVSAIDSALVGIIPNAIVYK